MHGYISPENGNKTVSVVVQKNWNCADALLAVGRKANISKSRQHGAASTALLTVLAAIRVFDKSQASPRCTPQWRSGHNMNI